MRQDVPPARQSLGELAKRIAAQPKPTEPVTTVTIDERAAPTTTRRHGDVLPADANKPADQQHVYDSNAKLHVLRKILSEEKGTTTISDTGTASPAKPAPPTKPAPTPDAKAAAAAKAAADAARVAKAIADAKAAETKKSPPPPPPPKKHTP